MRDRLELILKLVCLALVAFVAYQMAAALRRGRPLANVRIPALPTLTAETNAPAANKPASAKTNAVAAGETAKKGTNAPAPETAKGGTNSISKHEAVVVQTDPAPVKPVVMGSMDATHLAAMQAAMAKMGTNLPPEILAALAGGTNAGPRASSVKRGGPDAAMLSAGGMPPGMMMAGMPGMPGGKGPAPDLSPAIKARVYKIYDSEILGPIMRPQPMALLGIAGETVFLRAANGQTGLVKIGDELGGLKLLKIGINRVLVETEGQKKELKIFDGFGGESLL